MKCKLPRNKDPHSTKETKKKNKEAVNHMFEKCRSPARSVRRKLAPELERVEQEGEEAKENGEEAKENGEEAKENGDGSTKEEDLTFEAILPDHHGNSRCL